MIGKKFSSPLVYVFEINKKKNTKFAYNDVHKFFMLFYISLIS